MTKRATYVWKVIVAALFAVVVSTAVVPAAHAQGAIGQGDPTGAVTGTAKDVAEAEDVTEPTENVLEPGKHIRIEATGGRTAKARVPEAVVHVALVGVGQDRIRLSRFLEGLLGGSVARVAVRVVLERQLPVGALDLLLARVLRDAEDFVVVALAHEAATFTIAARSRRSPSM